MRYNSGTRRGGRLNNPCKLPMQKLFCSVRGKSASWGSMVFTLMVASFVSGFLLARFNVFGALGATAICASVSSFIYVEINGLTLAHVLETTLATVFALQAGYLV